MTRLAIIVVNYRTPDHTIRCVDALADARAAFPDLRVMVVDGGSADGSAEALSAAFAGRSWVTFLPLDLNGGFAFANNRAIAALAATGPLPAAIALINPDARVRPGALETMAALLEREPRAGAVGALLIHEDGRPQGSAFRFPSIRGEFSRGAATGVIDRLLGMAPPVIFADRAIEAPWVTGAAVMLRTAALAETGLFDEGFFLYFEETELIHRLRSCGWTVWHEPNALVVHDGGVATAIRDPETGLPRTGRMPRYWYESRRRYFALTGGASRVMLAGAAWLAGHTFSLARRAVTRAAKGGSQHAVGDLMTYGLRPRTSDTRSGAPALGDPPAERPFWMRSVP